MDIAICRSRFPLLQTSITSSKSSFLSPASSSSTMVQAQAISTKPWFLEQVPLVVVVLIAAHVFALVYWMYRVATEKQSVVRRKEH